MTATLAAAADPLDEDVLDQCSSFLVEEIEIEMQQDSETVCPDLHRLPPCSPVKQPPSPPPQEPVLVHDAVEEVVCVSSEEAVPMDTGSPPPPAAVDDFEPHSMEAPTPPDSLSHAGSFVCKWTNCDWPGSYDDLVDHIREIHVELQPYHSLPEQRVAPVASRRGSKCSSTISSCSSYENPASVTSSVSSEEASSSAVPAASSARSQPTSSSSSSSSSFANPCDLFRPSSAQPDKCYVCLWEGCKVYGIRSQKRSWLDRHVLQHSGDKPFKCIVENCGHRFKTQSALERHVNSHFVSSKEAQNGGGVNNLSLNSDGCSEHGSDDLSRRTTMMRAKGNGSVGGTPCKGSGKKKRSRPRKLLIRPSNEDFFDPAIMDMIQYRLFQQHQSALMQQVTSGHQPQPSPRKRHTTPSLVRHTTLHSTVIARRIEENGTSHLLLRWLPENSAPDEWVPESEVESHRSRLVVAPDRPSRRKRK